MVLLTTKLLLLYQTWYYNESYAMLPAACKTNFVLTLVTLTTNLEGPPLPPVKPTPTDCPKITTVPVKPVPTLLRTFVPLPWVGPHETKLLLLP
jgi:hypothetical protein